jgi:hypothetical protein
LQAIFGRVKSPVENSMPEIADPPDRIPSPPLAPQLARYHAEAVEAGAAWDALAAGFSDFCMEQSFAFAGARWKRLRAAGLILREEGAAEPAAVALALIATLPVLATGLAYVKFGPLWRRAGKPVDPAILRATLAALKEEFCARRGLVLRILPPADPGDEEIWKTELRAAGFSFHAEAPDPERYLVDLSLGEEEQLASLGAQWRANLKKASGELAVEERDLETGLPAFVALYENMRARKKFQDRHGIEDLPAIAREAGSLLGMRLFLASHRGEPVVGSILIGPSERVFVPFSATDDRALALRAGYALRWAVINRLRGTNARWLDLGGTEGDSGLRHYKLGNVGKRGKVVRIPGEYDFAPNARAAAAARAIELGRDLVRAPALKRLAALLPI